MVFHLHWLNFLFEKIEDRALAHAEVNDFLAKLERFKALGGRLVWTVHNTVSHDLPFSDLEQELAQLITQLADVIHVHSEASIAEVEEAFDIPREKVKICPHGSYVGAYPDFVSRAQARSALNIAEDDEVILFTGQVRPYKGVEELIGAFRKILKDHPKALLLVAGAIWAKQLWGQYWNWDPLETWSLVTFLFYAFYLHARSFLKWKMRRAAWLTVAGLLIVAVSFWGVTWFAPSVHPGP